MAIYFHGTRFLNARETGVKVEGGDVVARDVSFENVPQAWDLNNVRSADIRGTRIKNKIKNTRSKKKAPNQKLNGPPLPAFCPKCKAVFPSKNYNWGGSLFTAWDNEETCQSCGYESAVLSEGTFDLTQNTVRILAAPDFTHVMLGQAKRVADSYLSGALSEKEARKSFGDISPALRDILQGTPAFLYNAVMLIATVVAAYYACVAYDFPKEPPPDVTAATEMVLKKMSRSIITDGGVQEMGRRKASPDVLMGKPKAREARRKEEAKRRRALRGNR